MSFGNFQQRRFFAANGAERIIPVDDISAAYRLKSLHPEYMLAGERGGVIREGLDYGNSPGAIGHQDFTGKTVVLTTSAGTQGLAEAAKHADQVLTGRFVNVQATARGF